MMTAGCWLRGAAVFSVWLSLAVATEEGVGSCATKGGYYEPNMPRQLRSMEMSWENCRTRCTFVPGCAFFSFWPDGGCHLQAAGAHGVTTRGAEVVSGPLSCDAPQEKETKETKEHEECTDSRKCCPGAFDIKGYGKVVLVPTGRKDAHDVDVGRVEVQSGGQLETHMNARAYFADTCTHGSYDHKQYLGVDLLGKKLRYSLDVSSAGCGCNAAFYLTSMRQNARPSECSDYYCDANNVCGESCAEIDIQEASRFAWHSTLHTKSDHGGKGVGFGGGGAAWNGPRDFTAEEYGPGARCVDTNAPFDVEVAFPVDGQGVLEAMEVTLSQEGHDCPLKMRIGDYGGMEELSQALSAGMTPIVSYWSADDMLWLDGEGGDHQGPCAHDNAQSCGESVKIYGFSIEELSPPPAVASGDDLLSSLEAGDDAGEANCHNCLGNTRWQIFRKSLRLGGRITMPTDHPAVALWVAAPLAAAVAAGALVALAATVVQRLRTRRGQSAASLQAIQYETMVLNGDMLLECEEARLLP